MLSGHTNYRSYLKAVLAERVTENPGYSLRAFAKRLDMAPSTLAEVLKGKSGISQDRAVKIANKLGLTDQEKTYFCLLIQFEATKSNELKESILERLNEINPRTKPRDLSVDIFTAMANWYHVAILEMTYLEDLKHTPEAMAIELGISAIEACAALERLERLELLEKTLDGKYVKTDAGFRVEFGSSNIALRKFHKQMLEKSIESIESQSPQEKFIGTETFPLDPAQLKKAGELAEEFFQKILKLSRESKAKSHVYHAGVQVFRLTQPKALKKRGKL